MFSICRGVRLANLKVSLLQPANPQQSEQSKALSDSLETFSIMLMLGNCVLAAVVECKLRPPRPLPVHMLASLSCDRCLCAGRVYKNVTAGKGEGVKGDYKVRMLKAKIDEAEEEMDRCDRTPS